MRKMEGHTDVIKEGHIYPAYDFTECEIQVNKKP